MNRNITIIGGGVSGITTGLTLQLLGFQTTCYSEYFVNEKAPNDPRFASLYPAASVIPHSVQTDHLHSLFTASLSIFHLLHQQEMENIVLHRHFEVFEFPVDFPSYTTYLHNFSAIEDADDQPIPRRSGAPDLHGWVFDCFVAEWPEYISQLYRLYQRTGGKLKQKKIDKGKISKLPTEIVINCTGIWSSELFGDTAEQKIVRGHLVHIPDKNPILDSRNRLSSYNYTPVSSVYATPDGKPSDVYCYPVNGKWIWGGSRQAGTVTRNGNWKGQNHEDTISISGVEVPRPILELNKNILQNSYQADCNIQTSSIDARVGYRYSRDDTRQGLRMETTDKYGKKIIHNYGHGGAGITLSWGCALHVLHLIIKETGLNLSIDQGGRSPFLKGLQLELQKVYLQNIHQ